MFPMQASFQNRNNVKEGQKELDEELAERYHLPGECLFTINMAKIVTLGEWIFKECYM